MSRPPHHRTAVVSSVLVSMGHSYDAALDLEFRSGARYRYFAVPHTVVQGLLAAGSKGAYFNRHIKNRFRYRRLA